jgi:hypothetical protein
MMPHHPELPLRRLRRVAAALAHPAAPARSTAAAVGALEQDNEFIAPESYELPLPLPLTAGGVPAAALADLSHRQHLAAAAEDYQAATTLKQLATSLSPRPKPRL